MTGLSFGAYNAIVQYGFILLVVIAASRFIQVVVRGILAWFGRRERYGFFVLVVSHVSSFVVISFLSTVGVGVADFPTTRSFLLWSLILVGPPQLLFFVLELSRHLWRRRQSVNQIPG